MILGVGIDITAISRMAEAISRSGQVFIDGVFNANEQNIVKKSVNSLVYYSTIFSLKEAVFKAFGSGWQENMSMRDIEIKRRKSSFIVCLHNGFLMNFQEKKASYFLLHHMYSCGYVVATAVLYGEV